MSYQINSTHLENVSFDEAYVDDTGRFETFEATIQVEPDNGSYFFRVVEIFTYQKAKDGDGYFTAKTDTTVQIATELALREFVETGLDQEQTAYLEKLANDAGYDWLLMEAA